VLRAHRISKHSATKVTPFELVYGQEVILPVELNELSAVDYHNLMFDRLDEVSDERIKALGEIERDRLRVAKAYNKRVKRKLFQVGDLVWKMILPIGPKSSKFGKWSPNWGGSYRNEEVIPGNSYTVQSVQETLLPKAINEKYLKRYYPSIWQDA
jgi:hypothetical protein